MYRCVANETRELKAANQKGNMNTRVESTDEFITKCALYVVYFLSLYSLHQSAIHIFHEAWSRGSLELGKTS